MRTPSYITQLSAAVTVFLIGLFVFPGTVFGSYDPSTVLVLVNDAYPPEDGTNGMGASVYVGEHYAQVRQIPAANVVHLNIPLGVMHSVGAALTYDFLYYADYNRYLKAPVLNYMAQHGLTNQILYIVPTYGIPYMLFDGLPGDNPNVWRISLDAMLAAANSKILTSRMPNPYYNSSNVSAPPHFAQWTNPAPGDWKMYIVSRLDGPSAAIAAAQVDSAIAAEQNPSWKTSGTAYYDWAGGTGWPDVTMQNGAAITTAAAIPTVLHNQNPGMGLGAQGMLAPASTYGWTANGVGIFTQAASTLTARFPITPVNAGAFGVTISVVDNYAYHQFGRMWMRLYSANRQSWWELLFWMDSSQGQGQSTLTKVAAGKTVGTCQFIVTNPTFPVTTKDITLTFGPTTGSTSRNGTQQCALTDASNSNFSVSQAEVVFKDIGGQNGQVDLLNKVYVNDGTGASLWSDSFTTDTTGNYQWVTMPKQARNASLVWGWYSGIHDAYTLVPGAVAGQLNSWSATAIRSGGAPESDLNWTAYFLRLGATASWGATGEPYIAGYAMGDNIFAHMLAGYNYGEAAYIASPLLNWMMMFVGDPLYAPPAFSNGPEAPVINSPTTAVGTPGKAFSYQITTLGNQAESFGATGLPSGWSIDTKTGLISGTMPASTVLHITLSATSSFGTGTATLTVGPPRIHGTSGGRLKNPVGKLGEVH